MKVSVILPIHNVEEFLCEALDSITNQRFGKENIEIIMVYDWSTDNSGDILNNQIYRVINEINKERKLSNEIIKEVDNSRENIELLVNDNNCKLDEKLTENKRISDEIVWSQVFNNIIETSEWLINKSFAPGRWAAGYQYLYVLYRVLNNYKPNSILEFGLGQTTRMIGQYTEYYKNSEHFVVEHDLKWIEFFKKDFDLSSRSKIISLPLKEERYRSDDKVITYDGIQEATKNKKFDLISIDGPFGGKAKVYSKIDVLKLIPDCLASSFVILVDDFDRQGEKNTVYRIRKCLEENDIEYTFARYMGIKDSCIIVSKDLSFLCTM